jgi:micrococcal nuclease
MIKKGLCLLSCFLTLCGCQPAVEPDQHGLSQNPPVREQAQVLYVIDGDTIVVSRHGRREKVRFLLIDAPENTTLKEPFGQAATKRVRQLLTGQTVDLEYDIEQYDRYDRLLAYVYLHGQSVQLQLLSEGLAEVKVYPPNQKYEMLYRRYESMARQQQLGIWSQ